MLHLSRRIHPLSGKTVRCLDQYPPITIIVDRRILFGKSTNKEDWQLSEKSRYTEVYNAINGDPVNFWKYINQLYKGCIIDDVETLYSVSGAFQTEVELLISNY